MDKLQTQNQSMILNRGFGKPQQCSWSVSVTLSPRARLKSLLPQHPAGDPCSTPGREQPASLSSENHRRQAPTYTFNLGVTRPKLALFQLSGVFSLEREETLHHSTSPGLGNSEKMFQRTGSQRDKQELGAVVSQQGKGGFKHRAD